MFHVVVHGVILLLSVDRIPSPPLLSPHVMCDVCVMCERGVYEVYVMCEVCM